MAAHYTEEEETSLVPNIILPNEAPDGDLSQYADVRIMAQIIDLSDNQSFTDCLPAASSSSVQESTEHYVNSNEHQPQSFSDTHNHSSQQNEAAEESGDVDYESTPITSSRPNHAVLHVSDLEDNTSDCSLPDSSTNSIARHLLQDTQPAADGANTGPGQNSDDLGEEVLLSTIFTRYLSNALLPGPLTPGPTVVSSNASVAAPILSNVNLDADNEDRVSFEQLMNMDLSTLGEMADDEVPDEDNNAGDHFLDPWVINVDDSFRPTSVGFTNSDTEDNDSSSEEGVVMSSVNVRVQTRQEHPGMRRRPRAASVPAESLPSRSLTIPHLTDTSDSESEEDNFEANRPDSMDEDEWRSVLEVIRADMRESRARERQEARMLRASLAASQDGEDVPENLAASPPEYSMLRSSSIAVCTNLPWGTSVGNFGQGEEAAAEPLPGTSGLGQAEADGEEEPPPAYTSLFTMPDNPDPEPPAYTSLQFQKIRVVPHDPNAVRRVMMQDNLKVVDHVFCEDAMTLYARTLIGYIRSWYVTADVATGERDISITKKNFMSVYLNSPGGLCLDTKRKLFAFTSLDSIYLIKPSGKIKDEIKNSHDKKHEFKKLSSIDFCASADLYVVTDMEQHCVMLIKPKTRKVFKSFGQLGDKADEFNTPKWVKCCSHNDIVTLIVCDTGNNCVKVFNTEGQLLQTWGHSIQLEGRLMCPQGICVGSNGEIYVADSGQKRVVKFYTDRGVDHCQTIITADEMNNEAPLSLSFLPGGDYNKIAVVTTREDLSNIYDSLHKMLIFSV